MSIAEKIKAQNNKKIIEPKKMGLLVELCYLILQK